MPPEIHPAEPEAEPPRSTTDAGREIWVVCRVPRSEVCYLRYTLEAYEGLCVPTTLPGGGGAVRLLTGAAQRADLETLLEALALEMPIRVEGWGEGEEAPG